MKTKPSSIYFVVTLSVLLVKISAFAGTDVWAGGGGSANLFWLSTANWNPAQIPQTGDTLIFTNAVGLINSNNIPNGNFSGITFATPSGAFALNGNSVTLANITDLQVVTPETINFPITDNGPANLNLNIVANGVLNLNNQISGTGALTNNGAGTLNLNGNNTFAGPLVINAGTVAISAETNLSAPQVSPLAGNIVLNGGALKVLNSLVLNTNRGITVGSPTASGVVGTIQTVTNNLTAFPVVTYGGVIADNTGGAGGLSKLGLGGLTLFGQNTYTGTTSNEVGLLTLDFSQATAPQNNIISSSSQLVFGGANAGVGSTNYAGLVMTNKASTINAQAFNGTHVTIGAAAIEVDGVAGGTANLTLGSLDHDAGGVLTLNPPALRGGQGNIITTTTNFNGILGGWATIGNGLIVRGWTTATNWACVDGSGNIINFSGFTNYTSGYLKDFMSGTNNLLIPSTITGNLTNDVYSTAYGVPNYDEVNTVAIDRTDTPWTWYIGTNNVLRFGQSGGILIRNPNTAGLSITIGDGSGRITAGGPNIDSPGEIVFTSFQTGNSLNAIIADPIMDNGNGAVTFIKAGTGFAGMSVPSAVGTNSSYSGGTYVLGGRLRMNSAASFAPGPLYVFPGGYMFMNITATITNAAFISGTGAGLEAGIGAFRFGPNLVYAGPITLIGDSEIGGAGGSGAGGGNVTGPISGSYNLTLCNAAVINGDIKLSNPNNSWSGDTTLIARNNSGYNRFFNGASDVIPNGFGKGNVFMQGFSTGVIFWDLGGFDETINGLFSLGGGGDNHCIISNSVASTISTLTVGDNDQSGIFGGILKDGAGILALTKIGGGIETLTNVNAYTGATTISNGVLQLGLVNGSVFGSINNSTNVSINGGTFDVSLLATYAVPSSQTINISGGAWFISSASAGSSAVSITNGTLKITALSGTPNLAASTINLGAGANLIQPANIPPIDAYPKTFIIASYSTLNGDTNTLGVILPPGGFPAYAGYVTVDTGLKQILLVMTNGPVTPSLTWAGVNFNTHTLDGNWNVTDPNWTNKPAHTSASYSDGSLVTFDDGGATGVVTLISTNATGGATVANTNLNYTFIGSGYLTGTNGITKQGSGKLVLDNGSNDFTGSLSIATGGGIVQLGGNDVGGWLGNGSIGNNGTLVFNRNNSVLTVPNAISGSGGILVSNAASTTTILSGNNSGYNGSVYVQTGQTLAPANAGALSSTNGTVTIPTGTTLDVSGSGIAANTLAVGKMVQVSGAGVDGTSGAIVNNVATNQQNALLRVTLAGDTTFGGTGARWDIRGTPAQHGVLSTGGNLYNVIKKGAYFMSIANVDVDTALSNVDVQVGTLEVNGATTGMGNSGTLTIENGATLQLYNMTNTIDKQIALNGDGITTTLTNASGDNIITGPMTLGGSGPVIVAVNTGSLALSNAISGSGSLTKSGTNTLVLTGPGKSYSGATTVSDGTLLINNSINSGSVLTENTTATASTVPVVVGGNGTNGAAMDIEDTLWPGVSGKPATFGAGNNSDYVGTTGGGALVFNDSGNATPKAVFSLNTATTAGGGVNDLVTVNGNFNGNFASVLINPLTPLTVNSPYTLVTYTGNNTAGGLSSVGISVVGAFQPSRYTFTLDQTSNPHKTFLTVLTGAGNLVWNNAASTGIWDTNAANANWLNTGTSANDRFYQLDAVTFNDSIGAGVTTINIATTNVVPGTVTVSNTAVNYTFYGNGSIGGAANLVKQGTGMLTISNNNTFTGTLFVSGGTVQVSGANSMSSTLITNGTVLVNNTNGLGGVTAPIYVTNSGTLDIGGASFSANQSPLLGSKPIYISGWGVNSNGCLINSSANQQQNAFQNIIMTGDATIGGPGLPGTIGRFDIGRLTNNPTLSTGGHAYNLYKVGNNQVSFVALNVDPALADVDIKSGELGVETTTSGLGNPNNTVTVEPGATLEFFSLVTNLNKKVVLNGGSPLTNIPTIWFNGGSSSGIDGPVTLTNGVVVIGGSGTGILTNVVSGPGGMLLSCSLTLISPDTYTGNTIVSNNGTLFLTGSATINNSTNITILGGMVNVAQRANSTLTLAGSQTLSGIGTVAGTLTAPSGTTLTVGTNGAVGQLTVTTNVNLSGTLNMKLDAGNATNDVLAVGNTISFGGTLSLNNLSGTLAAGQSYKLFNATGVPPYQGSFASISPAHPNSDPSLNWDVSQLTTDGSIKVVSAVTPTPVITSIRLSGTTLTFTATNGTVGGQYALLSTTNVALPLAQWTPMFTNNFNGSGNINLSTNVVNPNDPQKFYILQVLP